MTDRLIKNFNELAITPNRKLALEIIEYGANAIKTDNVLRSSISITENNLLIRGKQYNLAKYKNIKVVGFGKSSGLAAVTLEEILGDKITAGVVISTQKANTKIIESFIGTHPKPSPNNILAGKKIFELISNSTENDLIIVLASGGGSALLCYPENEVLQGVALYEAFLKCGKTISEMNTVRKHISLFKGGGLVKIAYPATVLGLIFSDVPGDKFEDVASGPTYKDNTTIEDAKKIIKENNLGDFDLIETPKDDKYFEKVENFILVSNKTAVEAMQKKSSELNLKANILSTELYDETENSLDKIFSAEEEGTVVLAAGEPKITVKEGAGKGGRNLHMGLLALKKNISENSVFISFATDGMDNSDAAGAVVDKKTVEKILKYEMDVNNALEKFNSYPVFEKTGDMIKTGPTEANVSDIMILLNNKNG